MIGDVPKVCIMPMELDNALSALSQSTRTLVIQEVDKALQDTCVEYHRAESPTTRQLLVEEIQSLQVIVSSLQRVEKEYDEIIRSQVSSHNSSNPSGPEVKSLVGPRNDNPDEQGGFL